MERDRIDITDGEYRPFFQRTSTLIFAVIILLTSIVFFLSMGLINFGISNMKQESALAVVIETQCITTWKVDKWTATRKFNRSSVPNECTWNVSKDSWDVCDKYKTKCVAQDSTGRCLETANTSICIESHTEHDYDYNEMDWVKFQTLVDTAYNGNFKKNPAMEFFSDPRKYRYDKDQEFKLTVMSFDKFKTFSIDLDKYNSLKKNGYVKIKRRVKSKKITTLRE